MAWHVPPTVEELYGCPSQRRWPETADSPDRVGRGHRHHGAVDLALQLATASQHEDRHLAAPRHRLEDARQLGGAIEHTLFEYVVQIAYLLLGTLAFGGPRIQPIAFD